MTWDLRPARVECKCGRAHHAAVALSLVAERMSLVHSALWGLGWLRLAGTWTCPACVTRIGNERALVAAVLERAAAVKIVRTGGA